MYGYIFVLVSYIEFYYCSHVSCDKYSTISISFIFLFSVSRLNFSNDLKKTFLPVLNVSPHMLHCVSEESSITYHEASTYIFPQCGHLMNAISR